MPIKDPIKTVMLNALNTLECYASSHYGAGEPSADTEHSGGAYKRKVVTFANKSGLAAKQVGNATFELPAGSVVTGVGLWDALVGGNLLATFDVDPDETFSNKGRLIVKGLEINLN